MDTMNTIEQALNLRSLYHRIISANLANAETPHYKEKEIDFQEELKKRVEATSGAGHVKQHFTNAVDIKEKTETDGTLPNNGNTVDVEGQMVRMTENSSMYNALVSIMTKKFAMIRYAINGGR
jgi:flagellar basal-body rod protein FlgB